MRGSRKGKDLWKHLYKSAAWERLRGTKLTEEPFCRFCTRKGLKIPADVVDHIKEHKGDTALFHDYDNLQSLCFSCHNSTKQRLEKGHIAIEYGPNGFPLPIRRV